MLNLKNFDEFYVAVDMGFDIVFFIDGIRYILIQVKVHVEVNGVIVQPDEG